MPKGLKKQVERVSPSAAHLGFENKLWQAADALRGSRDASEYKHVVLGLIFLKYISDAFEEQHPQLEPERDQGVDPEDHDEFWAKKVFCKSQKALDWQNLKNKWIQGCH